MIVPIITPLVCRTERALATCMSGCVAFISLARLRFYGRRCRHWAWVCIITLPYRPSKSSRAAGAWCQFISLETFLAARVCSIWWWAPTARTQRYIGSPVWKESMGVIDTRVSVLYQAVMLFITAGTNLATVLSHFPHSSNIRSSLLCIYFFPHNVLLLTSP